MYYTWQYGCLFVSVGDRNGSVRSVILSSVEPGVTFEALENFVCFKQLAYLQVSVGSALFHTLARKQKHSMPRGTALMDHVSVLFGCERLAFFFVGSSISSDLFYNNKCRFMKACFD